MESELIMSTAQIEKAFAAWPQVCSNCLGVTKCEALLVYLITTVPERSNSTDLVRAMGSRTVRMCCIADTHEELFMLICFRFPLEAKLPAYRTL